MPIHFSTNKRTATSLIDSQGQITNVSQIMYLFDDGLKKYCRSIPWGDLNITRES